MILFPKNSHRDDRRELLEAVIANSKQSKESDQVEVDEDELDVWKKKREHKERSKSQRKKKKSNTKIIYLFIVSQRKKKLNYLFNQSENSFDFRSIWFKEKNHQNV